MDEGNFGFDLPDSQGQIHIHGDASGDYLYMGWLQNHGWQEGDPRIFLDSYEAAMADFHAQQMGLDQFDMD